MNIVTQSITHKITIQFEPRPYSIFYSDTPAEADTLVIDWRFRDGEWRQEYPRIAFYRLKKSGERYADSQSGMLHVQAPFADLIEATRPQYTPAEVTL